MSLLDKQRSTARRPSSASALNAYQTTIPNGLSNVVAIAAGQYHSVALKRDGTVVAWGDNENGQTNPPTGLTGVTKIAAGTFRTVALVADQDQTPPAPMFLGLESMTNALPSIQLNGPSNLIYVIQSSTNLTTWTALRSIYTDTGVVSFLDVSATNSKNRFYRAMLP